MARNSWIRKKRHFPQVPAEVGTANADALHADKSLADARAVRLRNFNFAPGLRFFELERSHAVELNGAA
jgi:hypothetical protein